MLSYRISPGFNMILIRIDGKSTIEEIFQFINIITNDADYDPEYKIIVNNKGLAEKTATETEDRCRKVDLAASIFGGFFTKPGEKAAITAC